MANAIYPKFKQSLLAGDANSDLDNNTTTDGPFVALVDTGVYTYSAAHQFYSDLSGIVGTDQRITAPTVTSGTLDGGDVTFSAVSGATVEALVIYRKNSGANTTWRLVAYIDTSVTGLPVTPNGGDITITWNASGIFTISGNGAQQYDAEECCRFDHRDCQRHLGGSCGGRGLVHLDARHADRWHQCNPHLAGHRRRGGRHIV
jgi:hypothetical protein